MASVNSGFDDRDASLRSENWFGVANHPTATFRSCVVIADGSHGTVTGDLTIKGVPGPSRSTSSTSVTPAIPGTNDRAAFRAAWDHQSRGLGLTLPAALGAGGVLVSKDIRLEIESELVRR